MYKFIRNIYIVMKVESIRLDKLRWYLGSKDIYRVIFEKLVELGYDVVAPSKAGNSYIFKKVSSFSEVCINYIRTSNTLRTFLEPEEVLYRWYLRDSELVIKEELPRGKLALYAVHPCDANSLVVLDALLGSEPRDMYYGIRRANSFVVIDDCLGGDEYCSCSDVGARIPWGGSGDLWLVRNNGNVYVTAISNKGTEFLTRYLSSYLNIVPGAPKIINYGTSKAELVSRLYMLNYAVNNPLWAQKARECVFCGSCLAVCPTCVCFDIIDVPNDDLRSGTRIRRWNACLFRSFTAVAGGRVFRESSEDRFKIKYYHKFLFIPRRFGIVGCVGCGRCTYFCPVGIDPVKVVKEVIGIAH